MTNTENTSVLGLRDDMTLAEKRDQLGLHLQHVDEVLAKNMMPHEERGDILFRRLLILIAISNFHDEATAPWR